MTESKSSKTSSFLLSKILSFSCSETSFSPETQSQKSSDIEESFLFPITMAGGIFQACVNCQVEFLLLCFSSRQNLSQFKRLENPSIHVSEVHQVWWKADLKALKLWKGRSGSSCSSRSDVYFFATIAYLTELFTIFRTPNSVYCICSSETSMNGFPGSKFVKCTIRQRDLELTDGQDREFSGRQTRISSPSQNLASTKIFAFNEIMR